MVSFASWVLNFQPHILHGILRCTYRAVAIHISQLFFQRILAANFLPRSLWSNCKYEILNKKLLIFQRKIILMKVDQSL